MLDENDEMRSLHRRIKSKLFRGKQLCPQPTLDMGPTSRDMLLTSGSQQCAFVRNDGVGLQSAQKFHKRNSLERSSKCPQKCWMDLNSILF